MHARVLSVGLLQGIFYVCNAALDTKCLCPLLLKATGKYKYVPVRKLDKR